MVRLLQVVMLSLCAFTTTARSINDIETFEDIRTEDKKNQLFLFYTSCSRSSERLLETCRGLAYLFELIEYEYRHNPDIAFHRVDCKEGGPLLPICQEFDVRHVELPVIKMSGPAEDGVRSYYDWDDEIETETSLWAMDELLEVYDSESTTKKKDYKNLMDVVHAFTNQGMDKCCFENLDLCPESLKAKIVALEAQPVEAKKAAKTEIDTKMDEIYHRLQQLQRPQMYKEWKELFIPDGLLINQIYFALDQDILSTVGPDSQIEQGSKTGEYIRAFNKDPETFMEEMGYDFISKDPARKAKKEAAVERDKEREEMEDRKRKAYAETVLRNYNYDEDDIAEAVGSLGKATLDHDEL